MNPQRWSEIKRIFSEAVDLSSEERKIFLDENCKDAEIYAEVQKLIHSDAESKTITNSIFTPLEFPQPKQIGNYKIIEEIGNGGMGTVFLAVREDLRKKVALKIVKYEFSSKELKRRFENERKILAALEHQNIARLLDGGTTESGLPYFVMEYVDGKDLLTYCNSKQLSIDERLAIFRKICAAVSYAHGKLVVHRDLKPSNILISADGEPKLLDFGISKLLDENSLEQTGTATAFGMLTPNYASPEQFRGETVGTSTDIYSLGVVLYELLTGNMPYKIKDKRIDEIARAVCEIEPILPSRSLNSEEKQNSKSDSNFSNLDKETNSSKKIETAQSIANLQRRLKGDLDKIILKALRKQTDRRYTSVEKLSDDIRRHLAGLPISARPDTFSYRAEKFVKRNLVSVISATLVLMSLLITTVGISSQYVRAEHQRELAEKRFGEVRQMANNVVFKYYDEADKLTGSTKMREMMVSDALSYLDGLAQDSASDESLQKEIGLAYVRIGKVQGRAYFANLGDTSSAVESYKKGISLLEPLILKSDDTKFRWDFINALGDLSATLRRQGKLAESDIYQKRATDLNEQFLAENPEDPTLLVRSAYSYYFIGDTLPLGLGENENIAAFRKSAATAEKVLLRDPNHARANNIYAADIQRIGYNLLILSRNALELNDLSRSAKLREEAALYYYQAIELGAKMVKLFPNDQLYDGILEAAKANESEYLVEIKQYEKALQISSEALQTYKNRLKNDPENLENKLNVSYIYANLNTIYLRLNEKQKAQSNYLKMIKLFDELIAHDGDNLDYRQKRLQAAYIYADELLKSGNIEEARKIYTTEFALAEEKLKEKDASFAISMRGWMLEKTGDCDSAILKNNFSSAKKNDLAKTARSNYEQALNIWQEKGMQIAPGVTDAERIKIVQLKLDSLNDK